MAFFARRNRALTSSLKKMIYRSFSTSQPELCYVMGRYGKIVFPGYRWQGLHDYFKKSPLLSPIPHGRLFGVVDPTRPYQLEDTARDLFRSAVCVPYVCRKNDHHILNPFWKDNVGVIEDLGIVAFKEIKPDPLKLWQIDCGIGYKQWNSFWKEMISDIYGSNVLTMLPKELSGYSDDLLNVTDDADEEFVVDHPSHLKDLAFGEMAFEVYRLLIKEGPALNVTLMSGHPALPKYKPDVILGKIGANHSSAYTDCFSHEVLPQWNPTFLRKKLAQLPSHLAALPATSASVIQHLQLTDINIGSIVVELTRHGCIHSVEAQIINLVKKVFGSFNFPFTRMEVLQLLRRTFPNHPRIAYLGFVEADAFDVLGTRERFPISDIYSSSSVINMHT